MEKKREKENIRRRDRAYMEKSDQEKDEPFSQAFPRLLQPVLSMANQLPLRMEETGMFHFTVSIRHSGFPVTGENRIRHERQEEGLHGNRFPADREI